MTKTVVYVSHPSLGLESKYCRVLLESVLSPEQYAQLLNDGSTVGQYGDNTVAFRYINKLYSETFGNIFPTMTAEIQNERKILDDSDVVAILFPLYWYSVPGSLKNFMDIVWNDGYAYIGSSPNKLKGKGFACIMVTGASNDVFNNKFNGLDLKDVTKQFEGTASFTGMIYREPFILCSGDYVVSNYNKMINKEVLIETKATEALLKEKALSLKGWLERLN